MSTEASKKPKLQATRPMTLPEKILAHHAVGLSLPQVQPGDMICVKVQWTLACEITWKSMDKTYQDMGRPQIWRNDRFWLAVDHTVDPRVNHQEQQKMMIKASEDFAEEAKLTNYQGVNQTILHTEFYRQRAQPGQIVVGADSHSCSTGGLGAFAIGLGAADVVMPLVTGETWIKVPETVKVSFVGAPPFGLGGKDVMLYTLGQLKCNSVAIGRVVEWTGNIKALSCDARFAIANMTAEFGGIAGIFPADEHTAKYIDQRQDHKKDAKYFRADEAAIYAESFDIQLDELEPQVALFPSPDNVQGVSVLDGKMNLDGCFIGACTTALEDLIMAGLVLREAMKAGKTPLLNKGKRRVTPGSVQIIEVLRKLSLLEVYEQAGFTVGVPGCSFCLGIAADTAGEGEVWLSSQNRNYRNRMGKNSIANLASSVTVAASSFDMVVTDPRPYLNQLDQEEVDAILTRFRGPELDNEEKKHSKSPFIISDPCPTLSGGIKSQETQNVDDDQSKLKSLDQDLVGRVQVFGDSIDTDAILPGEFLCENDVEKLGQVAFLHTNPDFRQKVSDGQTIVVAGHGFGCGSSREQAVTAMKGAGVVAIIARSFGYIFSRNYQNFSLLGIQISDERFYAAAKENAQVTIQTAGRIIQVQGSSSSSSDVQTFRYQMSLFEERLLAGGGVLPLFKAFGNRLFRVAVKKNESSHDEEDSNCHGQSHCSSRDPSTDEQQTDLSW